MVKTIEIECSGYTVKADWYEGKSETKILLALVGWPATRDGYADILTALTQQTGMSALVFDYSGLGDSSFDVSRTRPAQHSLEAIYVFDWLKAHHPNASISVMGTSYGGYLAAQLTKYREFDNLILRVPAIYPPSDFYTLNSVIHSDVGREAKRAYRNDAEALARHPLLTRASSFRGRTLVVVHEKDGSIPKPTTDAYIKTFNADVYIAEGFPHSLHSMQPEKITAYQKRIADWLKA